MSFSVRCERSGLEYNGTSLNTLFAQRRNLLRPRFYRMLRDILRFNREAPALLDDAGNDDARRLGDYLRAGRYSREFVEHYIVPMGAAIWSADPGQMLDVPGALLRALLRQPRHAVASTTGRTWRVIRAARAQYVDTLTRAVPRPHPPAQRRCSRCARVPRPTSTLTAARRRAGALRPRGLRLPQRPGAGAARPTRAPREREVLGAIPYQRERGGAAHRRAPAAAPPARLGELELPRAGRRPARRAAVTYNMNMLQGLDGAGRLSASR